MNNFKIGDEVLVDVCSYIIKIEANIRYTPPKLHLYASAFSNKICKIIIVIKLTNGDIVYHVKNKYTNDVLYNVSHEHLKLYNPCGDILQGILDG